MDWHWTFLIEDAHLVICKVDLLLISADYLDWLPFWQQLSKRLCLSLGSYCRGRDR